MGYELFILMMLITSAIDPLNVTLARTLNDHNFNYLVLADDFPARTVPTDLRFQHLLDQAQIANWIDKHQQELEFMFALGLPSEEPTDTRFRSLWTCGARYQIPLIFRATPDRMNWVQQQDTAPFFWAGLRWTDANGTDDRVPPTIQSLTPGLPSPTLPSEDYVSVRDATVAAASYFLIHHRTHSGWYALHHRATYRSHRPLTNDRS